MVNIKKKICVYCFVIKKNHNYGKQKNNISKVSYSIYTNKEIPFFCTKNNIFKKKIVCQIVWTKFCLTVYRL